MRRSATLGAVVGVLVLGVASVALAAGSVWNVEAIGGPRADPGSVIAVVDTGVDAAHPAFGSRVQTQINIVGGPGDGNGHGTHVAGTAAGGSLGCQGFDGQQAIGVAPGATILPVQVLADDGSGYISDVAQGIKAAADRGATVINLSLGQDLGSITGSSNTFIEALEYAWNRGSIPVVAAGNDGIVGGIFGSGFGDVNAVVVTAVNRNGSLASYATSIGSAKWGIAAPGGDGADADRVWSAYPNERCASLAGTSMAAPHVSGTLAILRARGLSPAAAVQRMLDKATPKSPQSVYGAGLLNLEAAVAGLAPAAGTPAEPTPTTAAPAPATTATTPGPSGTGAPTSTEPGSGTTSPQPSSDAATSTSDPGSADDSDGSAADDDAAGDPGVADDGDGRDADESETAADLTVNTDDGNGVPAPLAVGAGVAVVAMWVLVGRSARTLRV